MGGPDRARAAHYRDFVPELHGRLSPEMRTRISFMTGVSGAGAAIAKLALLVLVVGVGAAVVALAPHLGGMEFHEVLLVIVVLPLVIVPFWRLVGANQGKPYHPDRIPDRLLP
jgi:hypothetical protein